MKRSRSDKEPRLYTQTLKGGSRASQASVSSSSTTLLNDPPSTTTTSFSTTTTSQRLRRSEVSSQGRRSPSMSDFGQFPSPTSPQTSFNTTPLTRPTSVSSARSEKDRLSKYSASIAPSDSQSHYSHASHLFHHRRNTEDFDFPRPSDDDVDVLFDQVRLKRGSRLFASAFFGPEVADRPERSANSR